MVNPHYNRFRRFCAWLVGIVFVISGVLKLMDPVGAGLVMDEYWSFFHVGFLHFISKPAGYALALVEAVTGVALVTGVWRKPAAMTVSVMMLIFTVITAILAIFNPPMDCGCFGEALHLTNLQTFIKNLVIDALILIAFLPFRDLGVPRKVKYGTFALVSLSILAFSIYSLLYNPLKDYTDYRPGAQLALARSEVEETVFESKFVYEKDGREKVFTLDDLPDTSWTFVRSETSQNDHLQTAPALSFRHRDAVDSLGQIIFADSLAVTGNVLAVTVYNPARFDRSGIQDLLSDAAETGYSVLVLTTDPDADGEDEYIVDYRSAIGMNRSNGGLTLIQDGTIVSKWSARKLPSKNELDVLYYGEPEESLIAAQSRGSLLFQAFLLYVFAVMLLV